MKIQRKGKALEAGLSTVVVVMLIFVTGSSQPSRTVKWEWDGDIKNSGEKLDDLRQWHSGKSFLLLCFIVTEIKYITVHVKKKTTKD